MARTVVWITVTKLTKAKRFRATRTAPNTPQAKVIARLDPVKTMAQRAASRSSTGIRKMVADAMASATLAITMARQIQIRSQKAAETARLDSEWLLCA